MKTKLKVTARAVLIRMNRVLVKDGLCLKKSIGPRARAEMGEYFVVHGKRGEVVEAHVNLEKFARKHEILKPWEEIC
jgi:hypothetical protein